MGASCFSRSLPIILDHHKYFGAMLRLLNHDSLLMSSFTLNLWHLVLRIEKARALLSPEFFENLIQVVARKMIRAGDPEEDNSPSCKYSAVDFETSYEFALFFSKYRCQLIDVVRNLASIKPLECFVYSSSVLSESLAQLTNAPSPVLPTSVLYMKFEGAERFLDGVMTGIPVGFLNESGSLLGSYGKALMDLFELVMAFQPRVSILLFLRAE